MKSAEGYHGVGNGLDRERVNTIDVARGLLVLAPQIEHDGDCRRQRQDGAPVVLSSSRLGIAILTITILGHDEQHDHVGHAREYSQHFALGTQQFVDEWLVASILTEWVVGSIPSPACLLVTNFV